MKKFKTLCPFRRQSPKGCTRLYQLDYLKELMENSYVLYFSEVDHPYSREELEIFIRIIEMFDSLFKGKAPCACVFGKGGECGLSAFREQSNFLNLVLPEEDSRSCASCLHQLVVLEKKLSCFFASHTGGKRYSVGEKRILKQIRKMLIHLLKDTPSYELFKRKHTRRLSLEEKEELQFQKKDKILLDLVPIHKFNPFSQKYKKMKEEKMKEIEEMEKKAMEAKKKEWGMMSDDWGGDY